MKHNFLKQSVFIATLLFSTSIIFTGCSKSTPTPAKTKTTTGDITITVSSFAGSGLQSTGNGIGTTASFNVPRCLATDAAGNIYVADAANNLIRKIDPTGLVSTFAGTGVQGKVNGSAATASFNLPFGVAADTHGNVYVADTQNGLIRKINQAGVVSTFAGNGKFSSVDGPGTTASFAEPYCVAVDPAGNVYVGEISDVRKITPVGVVTTLAGGPVSGSSDGTGSAASFNLIQDIAIDAAGNIYVADSGNNQIRKITQAGVVTTVAGRPAGGSANGNSNLASFYMPGGIAVDVTGNIYVADSGNNLIRKISTAGIVTTVAGCGLQGATNGTGSAASFNNPLGITADPTGNIYVADANNIIRKITFK